MLKKSSAVLLVLILLLLTSCGSGKEGNNPVESTKETENNKTTETIDETPESTSLMELFSGSKGRLLVYDVDNKVAKDSRVSKVFIIENGNCSEWYTKMTLGELSKMTDNEIVEELKREFFERFNISLASLAGNETIIQAVVSGRIGFSFPESYGIRATVETDDSGNVVKSETVYLPNTIEKYFYDFETSKYYNPNAKDSSSLYEVEEVLYTRDFYKTYSFVDSSPSVKTVYSSDYICFESEGYPVICIRSDKTDKMNIYLDGVDSDYVFKVDPDRNDEAKLIGFYRANYENSFLPIEKIYGSLFEKEYLEAVKGKWSYEGYFYDALKNIIEESTRTDTLIVNSKDDIEFISEWSDTKQREAYELVYADGFLDSEYKSYLFVPLSENEIRVIWRADGSYTDLLKVK